MRSVPSWRALSFLPRVTAHLDSAYLARDMCDVMSAMGIVSRIKPKSNIVRNVKGSQPWRVPWVGNRETHMECTPRICCRDAPTS